MQDSSVRKSKYQRLFRRTSLLSPRYAISASTALLVWSCAADSPAHDQASNAPPDALQNGTDQSPPAQAPGCPGASADELVPDAPTESFVSQPSPCSALDSSVDWPSVPVLAASARQGLRMRVRNASGGKIDVCIEGAQPSDDHYELFINADGNPATGVTEIPWRSLGAEYKVVDDYLHGPSAGYAWSTTASPPKVATHNTNAIVVHIDKQLLRGFDPAFSLAFRRLSSGWGSRCSWLPGAANHPARLELPRVPAARRAQRGLIIPVYALVAGVNPKSIKDQLDPARCSRLLNGDSSVVTLLDTEPTNVKPAVDPNEAKPSPWDQVPEPDPDADPNAAGGDIIDPIPSPGDAVVPPSGPTDEDEDEDDSTTGKPDEEQDDDFDRQWDISGTPTEGNEIKDVWAQLADGAAYFKAKDPSRDFWVAVNGPDHQPFRSKADFKAATKKWDPIQEAGGEIFGYVHTHVTPTSAEFVSECDVLADVVRWKLGYPEIKGIWIDEYYPHYEGPPAKDAHQSDPSGGYYARLVQAIRRLYPELKLVGNAGAPFVSDRLRYGDLVDVACTFEQNAQTATQNDFSGLTKAPIVPSYAQLALIHGFVEKPACAPQSCSFASLEQTVERAFDYGYSHLFVTDAAYQPESKQPKAPTSVPVRGLWQDLPAYFDELLDAVGKQIDQRR